MLNRVSHLFLGQTDIQGVKNGADHRNGEIELQVAVAVPVHYGHRIAGLDPNVSKKIGKP